MNGIRIRVRRDVKRATRIDEYDIKERIRLDEVLARLTIGAEYEE